jgi:hypothetical protein
VDRAGAVTGFYFRFERKAAPQPRSLRRYDAELDNISSILMDIGERWRDAQCVELTMGGFGEDRWWLSLDYDVPLISLPTG